MAKKTAVHMGREGHNRVMLLLADAQFLYILVVGEQEHLHVRSFQAVQQCTHEGAHTVHQRADMFVYNE